MNSDLFRILLLGIIIYKFCKITFKPRIIEGLDCTPASDYSAPVLDWSTDQNPYGTAMITDTHRDIIQGKCDTCQTVATASYLSAMYNIRVYEWFLSNGLDCDTFQPITISPRSIIDLILYANDLNYSECSGTGVPSQCGLLHYFELWDPIMKYSPNYTIEYLQIANTRGDTTGVTSALIKHGSSSTGGPAPNRAESNRTSGQYNEIIECPDDGIGIYNYQLPDNPSIGIWNYIDSAPGGGDSDYKTNFNPDDLLFINIDNYRHISEPSPTVSSRPRPTFTEFISPLIEQLKSGPVIYTTEVDISNGLYDSHGVINLLTADDVKTTIDGHSFLIIGYDSNDFIILNSWKPDGAGSGADIKHRLTKQSFYDNYLYYDHVTLTRSTRVDEGDPSKLLYLASATIADITLKPEEFLKLTRLHSSGTTTPSAAAASQSQGDLELMREQPCGGRCQPPQECKKLRAVEVCFDRSELYQPPSPPDYPPGFHEDVTTSQVPTNTTITQLPHGWGVPFASVSEILPWTILFIIVALAVIVGLVIVYSKLKRKKHSEIPQTDSSADSGGDLVEAP